MEARRRGQDLKLRNETKLDFLCINEAVKDRNIRTQKEEKEMDRKEREGEGREKKAIFETSE